MIFLFSEYAFFTLDITSSSSKPEKEDWSKNKKTTDKIAKLNFVAV
jgi:hypothetical protein